MVELSPGVRRAILNPDRKLSVELMVPMDNGEKFTRRSGGDDEKSSQRALLGRLR